MVKPGMRLVDPGAALVRPGKRLVDPGAALVNPGKALVKPGKRLVDPGGALVKPGGVLVFIDDDVRIRDARFLAQHLENFADPEVMAMLERWTGSVAVLRRQGTLTRPKDVIQPWIGPWLMQSSLDIHDALDGRSAPDVAMARLADRWMAMRAAHG